MSGLSSYEILTHVLLGMIEILHSIFTPSRGEKHTIPLCQWVAQKASVKEELEWYLLHGEYLRNRNCGHYLQGCPVVQGPQIRNQWPGAERWAGICPLNPKPQSSEFTSLSPNLSEPGAYDRKATLVRVSLHAPHIQYTPILLPKLPDYETRVLVLKKTHPKHLHQATEKFYCYLLIYLMAAPFLLFFWLLDTSAHDNTPSIMKRLQQYIILTSTATSIWACVYVFLCSLLLESPCCNSNNLL